MARRALPAVTSLLSGDAAARGGPAVRGAVPGRPGIWAAGPAGQPGWPRRIVVLEDLVDHGNVGGIFRCAAALGVDAVILSPRCADPLYRRAVKVSMGAVFAIPYARMPDWRGGLAEIRAAGFTLLALTPDQSAVPLDKVTSGGPGRAAARHRGRRAVLALAGRGRHGGLHSDERGRDGPGGRLAERRRGRRDRLSRTGAPAPVTPGGRARGRLALPSGAAGRACGAKYALESLRHRRMTAPRPISQVRMDTRVPAAAPARAMPSSRNRVSSPNSTVATMRAQVLPALFISAIQTHSPMLITPMSTEPTTTTVCRLWSWAGVSDGSACAGCSQAADRGQADDQADRAHHGARVHQLHRRLTTEDGGPGRTGSGILPGRRIRLDT